MESLRRTNRFLNIDMKQSVLWFWGTMLLINIISYLIMSIYGFTFFGISGQISFGTTTSLTMITVAAANLMPIVIYFGAYSYEMYYQSFPVALAFSITRKEFYKALILRNISTALIFALIQSTLMKLDIYIVSKLGGSPSIDFGMFNTSSDSIIFIMISLLLAFLTFTSTTNLLAALNYRFGLKLWIGIGVVFSLSTVFIGASFWKLFNELFTTRINSLQLVKLGVIMVVCYSIGYIIVTNTNIKNKIS